MHALGFFCCCCGFVVFCVGFLSKLKNNLTDMGVTDRPAGVHSFITELALIHIASPN